MATSGSLVTRKYNNFRGIDTREGDIALNRSPDALNIYKNYKSSNMLETRPDIELLTSFSEPVYGLFFYEVGLTNQLIVHSGTALYKVTTSEKTKSDNIVSVKFYHDDIDVATLMGTNTYEWRYAAVGVTTRFFVVFDSNGMYIYQTIYHIPAQSMDNDYLIGYWKTTDNKHYEYVEDISKVPSTVKSGKSTTKYGETVVDYNTITNGNVLIPQSVPATTLPLKLYSFSKTTLKANGMSTTKSNFFVYNNILYIKDSLNYLWYNGTNLKSIYDNVDDANNPTYIPTTSISRKPGGGGTIYEDVNMMSSYRKNTFCADGTSTKYYLDAKNLDGIKSVYVNGDLKTISTDYTVNTTDGYVEFTAAPSIPDTDGEDNVEITYRKIVSGYEDRIKYCSLICVFDNRVFFSGNINYPNVLWHSSLDDPTYISDLDYYNEGLDLAKIKALVPGNNALWVFKEPSQANTTVFYHLPTIDSQYGKIYPSSHSSISTGCIATGINFNDDICFFSPRGLEGISGDITSEQVVAHRSTFIDNKLLSENNYSKMILDEWEGYLLTIIDNKIYLADSRQVTNISGAYEYDWYYWELSKTPKSTCVKDGVLYLGCEDGIYTLTETKNNVENYWTTPIDTFGYGNYQKTTNKRGCVMEVAGDSISVYAKTNKDNFTLINTFTDVTDYIVARIKKKKFKDVQLKIYSNKYMELESIMIEAFVGSYIKR